MKQNEFRYEKDKAFPKDIVYILFKNKHVANYYPKQDMMASSSLNTRECLCSSEELMNYINKELKASLQFNEHMSNMQ